MEAQEKRFFLYPSFRKHVEKLSVEDRGRLLSAMLGYQANEQIQSFEGNPALEMCWSFIQDQFDRDNLKYQARCFQNAENGKKGGRPKKPNGYLKTERLFKKAKKADYDYEDDYGSEDDSENDKKQKKIFQKPSVSEITEYCKERKNKVDPQQFHDFYESKGWKIGSTPMKNWQAAIRTWEKNQTRTTEPKELSISEKIERGIPIT